MKIQSIIQWPAALAISATAILSGCATQPVAEYRYNADREFATTRGDVRIVRRVRVEQGPYHTGRYRSVEPVGERVYIRSSERPLYRTMQPRFGGWREEAVVPYGPNSPVSPSQWF